MDVIGATGPLLALDVADARLVLAGLESLEREVARVAPSQLGKVRLIRADVARFLASLTPPSGAGGDSATVPGDEGRSIAMLGSGMNARGRDLYATVTEAAARLSMSTGYVRRMAPSWGGVQVAGRWSIPLSTIERIAKGRGQ